MKTLCLLIIGCALLRPGLGYAVPQRVSSSSTAGAPSGQDIEQKPVGRLAETGRNHRRTADKIRRQGQGNLPKPLNRKRPTSANTTNVHPPSDAVKRVTPAVTTNSLLPVKPSNNVRHRAPNPAVVGGATDADAKNTGAVNGTRMKRQP